MAERFASLEDMQQMRKEIKKLQDKQALHVITAQALANETLKQEIKALAAQRLKLTRH